MTDVTVPHWGLTMETVELQSWLIGVGDRVAEGDPVAEVETDKTNAEIVAPAGGVITALLADEGDEVAAGAVIATLAPDAG